MSEGNKYLRIDEETQIAMNLIAVEITASTGKKVSANAALKELLRVCRPDVAEKAKELARESRKKKGNSGS